jgi:hypothetical protein
MDETIVRLWYEYLKRSQNYKDYCKIMRSRRSTGDLKNSKHNAVLKKIPYDTYHAWGDIFKAPYEESRKRFLRSGPMDFGPIQELRFSFRTDAINAVKQFQKINGRKMTLGEFINVFDKAIKKDFLYLKIAVTKHSTTEILDHLKTLIDKKKSEKRIRNQSFINKQNFAIVSERLRINEIEHYLKTYDLWLPNNVIMKDIIRKIGTPAEKADFQDQNVVRKYWQYVNKAKKIIKNVERGFFPGVYN